MAKPKPTEAYKSKPKAAALGRRWMTPPSGGPARKLSVADAEAMRQEYLSSRLVTHRSLAEKWGVSDSTVFGILSYRSHIPLHLQVERVLFPREAMPVIARAATLEGKSMLDWMKVCIVALSTKRVADAEKLQAEREKAAAAKKAAKP